MMKASTFSPLPLALALFACSSADNQAACEAWINTYNDLPCVDGALGMTAAAACPESLNDLDCDASEYYDCLMTNVRCMDVGGTSVPDTSGLAACGANPQCD